MKKLSKLFSISIAIALIAHCQRLDEKKGGDHVDSAPQRIVSLSPSTTEIIYALGLQNRLVGVTDFCKYPSEAQKKPHVGGFLDPNFEAIASLNPDMVFILPEQQNVQNFLKELNIPFQIINNKTVNDILNSIKIIGKVCHVEQKAHQLADSLSSKIKTIRELTGHLSQPKVLISVGRTVGNGNLADIYAAGENTYYSELIRAAGGQNVLTNKSIAYPLLSAEGVIELNPDIIIDIIYGTGDNSLSENAARRDWQQLPQVNAVKNDRIFVINDSYAVIPGPRFVQLLDTLAKIIHPQIFENYHEKTMH